MRYALINNKVLGIYRDMDEIRFPIEPEKIISKMPNCRMLSYSKLAEISESTLDTVTRIAQSDSGCTQYDRDSNRFLILYNDAGGSVSGRILWTKVHELGHVVLNHFTHLECNMLSENSFVSISNTDIEREADAFASTLLCPFPILKSFSISSPKEIESRFGLSKAAAEVTYDRYRSWVRSHRKTAWENDMLHLTDETYSSLWTRE